MEYYNYSDTICPLVYIPTEIFNLTIPGEIWTPLYGASYNITDGYFISTYGRIYSAIAHSQSNKILSGTIDGEGYVVVRLKHIEKNKNGVFTISHKCGYSVHRLVLLSFNYFPGCEELEVNHINGIKTDNRVINLEWCTGKENMQHVWAMGLKTPNYGETNGNSKYTDKQIYDVVSLIKEGLSYKEISNTTGVAFTAVCGVARGHFRTNISAELGLFDYRRCCCRFTDNDVHSICKYFQDNSHKYDKRSYLFRDLVNDLSDIFPEGFTEKNRNKLDHIFKRNTFKHVSCAYNWNMNI